MSEEGTSSGVKQTVRNDQLEDFVEMMSKISLKNGEDEVPKAIKIPQFSDGSEWEPVVFELKINLEKHWKHKELEILEYLEGRSVLRPKIHSESRQAYLQHYC
jgi:hypothetical protein